MHVDLCRGACSQGSRSEVQAELSCCAASQASWPPATHCRSHLLLWSFHFTTYSTHSRTTYLNYSRADSSSPYLLATMSARLASALRVEGSTGGRGAQEQKRWAALVTREGRSGIGQGQADLRLQLARRR